MRCGLNCCAAGPVDYVKGSPSWRVIPSCFPRGLPRATPLTGAQASTVLPRPRGGGRATYTYYTSNIQQKVLVSIRDELRTSYLDYAIGASSWLS
jgi:hypothetical protein